MDIYILMELNIVVPGTISPHLFDTTDLRDLAVALGV